MTGLQKAGLPLPDAWRNIAAYVLNADLQHFFEYGTVTDTRALRRIADDLRRWDIKLVDEDRVRHSIGDRIYREIQKIGLDESSAPRVQWLNEVLTIVLEMDLRPRLWRSQNVFYLLTKGYRKGEWVFVNDDWKTAFERLAELLKVRLKN